MATTAAIQPGRPSFAWTDMDDIATIRLTGLDPFTADDVAFALPEDGKRINLVVAGVTYLEGELFEPVDFERSATCAHSRAHAHRQYRCITMLLVTLSQSTRRYRVMLPMFCLCCSSSFNWDTGPFPRLGGSDLESAQKGETALATSTATSCWRQLSIGSSSCGQRLPTE